jgi:hypothetical protein
MDRAGSDVRRCGERYEPYINEAERNSKYGPEYEAEYGSENEPRREPDSKPLLNSDRDPEQEHDRQGEKASMRSTTGPTEPKSRSSTTERQSIGE